MIGRLLLLTDRTQLPSGRTLLETVDACVAAGARTIVLRELDLPTPARAALAELVVALVAARGARVIAAHVHLPGAVGVHLPATASSCSRAATPRCLGRSCHSADDVHRAAAEEVDYATLSPFAVSASKPGRTPLPARAFAGHVIPVYALGGITLANAAEAVDAGAHGIAVMGEVMRADDPGAVVRDLLEAIR